MQLSSWTALRRLTWDIIDTPDEKGRHVQASTTFNVLIFALIVLNVLATVAGTVESVQAQFGSFLRTFELVSVIVFTVEYVLRLWACIEDEAYEGAISGRIDFAWSLPALVDLAAILPFYLTLGLDLRVVRVLRLFRIFRLAKAARYFPALRLFGQVFREKREEIVISLAALAMLLVMTSSLIYYAERGVQPDVFGSIPEAFWWSVITVTTVGYGDAYPVTMFGKFLGGLVALLGTGIGAIPAGLLASGFSEAIEENEEDDEAAASAIQYCPHCGSDLARPVKAHHPQDAHRQIDAPHHESTPEESPLEQPVS
jgi:voltage-gated potassium channel